MDDVVFDRWTRTLSACLTRRGLAALVTGGVCAGVAVTLDATDVDAKKNKKKKKKKKPGCRPDCVNKDCGSNSCGGSCGTCEEGEECVDGQCEPACEPDCGDNECGDDGCGGSCGSCGAGVCVVGLCQCPGKFLCNGACGCCDADACSDGEICVAPGECASGQGSCPDGATVCDSLEFSCGAFAECSCYQTVEGDTRCISGIGGCGLCTSSADCDVPGAEPGSVCIIVRGGVTQRCSGDCGPGVPVNACARPCDTG